MTDELVELKLDESNELLFKINVQGTTVQPIVRMVCESNGVSYMFDGESLDDGEVKFIVPSMKNNLKEDVTYHSRIEVLVENRFFSPVEFDVKFKQTVKVMSEGFRVIQPKAAKQQDINVTAQIKSVPVQTTTQPRKTLQEKFESKKGLSEQEYVELTRKLMKKVK